MPLPSKVYTVQKSKLIRKNYALPYSRKAYILRRCFINIISMATHFRIDIMHYTKECPEKFRTLSVAAVEELCL